MTKQKIQPKTVNRIVCPKCGELMVKFYPYSSIGLQAGAQIPPCGKCTNKAH